MNAKRGKIIVISVVALFLFGAIIYGIRYYLNDEIMPMDERITIGFCADNLVIERWQRDQEIFQAKAMKEDVDVIVYNANEDNVTQNKQIRLLIDKKVDVMVVIPYDKDGISDAINDAKKAGIKVIAYDRLINNADIDAYVSFDNVKVGELMAASLTEAVPKGNYIIINGSPDDNNSSMFREGYMKGLSPFINKGDIRVVAETWAENWREEYAYNTVIDILKSGRRVDAVIGANDRLAEAAIRALAENGMAGDVYVAGHDADISACQRIVEGTQLMTVYKPIRTLAETAVELAIQFAEDKDVQSNEFIDNGFKDVPYIKLDVLAVTKDTLEETVIEDGFHKKEDIYREP